ncbi:type IV secretion system protein [Phenylobacterium sp.]|jgi:type IV secretion system protein VirB6|uniref:type IV secretion system protein n=1 Tax=Phenylobacterium sp. TaxID=1871053 RepID=UPI002E325BE1|nr:type IV secretion system protein [Phenylobacterium sp.]HEX2560194.1 type IV secretion system protein [Phenylobacterium sp.]
MAYACPLPEPDEGMVRGLLTSVDCNVQGMAEAGYAALAQPGSPLALALTLLLTIYIALFGFRLLVGRASLRIGDLTMTALKIGAVLALATNWPTYQQLVFDTLFRGPEQLAGSILGTMQGPAAVLGANPFQALQVVYDEMQSSAAFLSGRTLGAPSPLQGGPAFAAFALNTSAFLMLMTSLGAVLAAKIVLGVLLGLGPLFIVFLLFDATRGIFEGWLRACLAFALAPLMAVLGLVVQLTLIAPHVVRLAELRAQGLVDLTAPNAIFLLTMVSTGVSIALGVAVGVIALSLRLPRSRANEATVAERAAAAARVDAGPSLAFGAPRDRVELQPRAAAIAAAAAAMERRESRVFAAEPGGAPRLLRVGTGSAAPAPLQISHAPLGHAYRRTARPPTAASNVRRDR